MLAPVRDREPHGRTVVAIDGGSLAAEQSVIGGLLLDNSARLRIDLHPLHFADSGHAVMYSHILQLIEDGARADVTTLADSLGASGKLTAIGGLGYISEIIENVPTSAVIEHYASIVRDRATVRELAQLATEIGTATTLPGARRSLEAIDDAIDRLKALRDRSGGTPGTPALDLRAMASTAVPPREYRVGRIMATGTIGEWSGHGGAGKTQCALHLAICLATGLQFFGEPTKPSRVAFVSAEDDANELHRRLAAQATLLNVNLADLDGELFVYDLTTVDDPALVTAGPDRQLMTTKRYSWLRGELERRGVTVLILDNRSVLYDGEINMPGAAARVLGMLNALVPAGGNVILLSHVDKATARGGYSPEAYSGTAGWHNRARWRWYLFTSKDEPQLGELPEPDDGRRILEVQKNNAGPTGARFPLQLVDGRIQADGIHGGIVASIERSNERKALLKAIGEAIEREIHVPTAESGLSTAHEALEAMPSFPAAFRGRSGRQRLFKSLRQLRADRVLTVGEFKGAGRHFRGEYRLLSGTAK